MPDLLAQIEQGKLGGLKKWLNEKIHQSGKRLTAAELVEQVTGQPLSADFFSAYLEEKFGEVYGLSS